MDEYFNLKDNVSHFWNTLVNNKMHTCTFFHIMMLQETIHAIFFLFLAS